MIHMHSMIIYPSWHGHLVTHWTIIPNNSKKRVMLTKTEYRYSCIRSDCHSTIEAIAPCTRAFSRTMRWICFGSRTPIGEISNAFAASTNTLNEISTTQPPSVHLPAICPINTIPESTPANPTAKAPHLRAAPLKFREQYACEWQSPSS